MLKAAGVAMMHSILRSAARIRLRYSLTVRSHLPVLTSMLMSVAAIIPSSGDVPSFSGTITSMMSSVL